MFDDNLWEKSHKSYELEKLAAYKEAERLLKTAKSFDEIVNILAPYYNPIVLLDTYEKFKDVNIYYNSSLAKVMREMGDV